MIQIRTKECSASWPVKKWEEVADYTAVYVDRGLSNGMRLGIDICKKLGRPICFRSLGEEFRTDAGRAAIKELLENGVDETIDQSVLE